MAFTLTIGGTDRTAEFDEESLTVTEALQANGQTMQVVVVVLDQAFTKPLGGEEIIFERDGIREFAGRIAVANEVAIAGPTDLGYQLNCVDYTQDLDAHLIVRDYESQLAGDIVRSIVGVAGRGFTVNNVADAITIGKLRANYEKPTNLITRIAESIEHQWYVDYNRDVNFFFLLNRPAPITEIDLDTDLITYSDAEIEELWEQVKNRIFLSGAKLRSTNQHAMTFTGDGSQTFFPLGFEPWDIGDVTVKLDGVDQSLLFDSIDGSAGDGLGSAGEAYVCLDNWGVRFPDASPPGNNVAVTVDYNFAENPILMVEDPASIAKLALRENTATAPSDGVHELKYEIPDLRVEDINTLWEYSQLLLIRYANIVFRVRWNSHVQGWRIGQNLLIKSAAARRDFNRTVYVTSLTKTIRRTDVAEMEYQLEGLTTPFPV